MIILIFEYIAFLHHSLWLGASVENAIFSLVFFGIAVDAKNVIQFGYRSISPNQLQKLVTVRSPKFDRQF